MMKTNQINQILHFYCREFLSKILKCDRDRTKNVITTILFYTHSMTQFS
jgi:hypothetical protein